MLHHLTLWVPDLERASPSWSWLLGELGYTVEESGARMLLCRDGNGFTLVLEQSADMVPGMLHSRMRPGLNHVAFTVASSSALDGLLVEAPVWGWSVLSYDGHPIAGGNEVAYLEDRDGFEVELVAVEAVPQ